MKKNNDQTGKTPPRNAKPKTAKKATRYIREKTEFYRNTGELAHYLMSDRMDY